jgi:2-polyprenyl-3-methyl-5-hydroxy-6-metoxy-1,4-benzoquinol methylase
MKSERPLRELEEERVVPWGDPGHFAWHLARYRFAVPFVAGKRVLDVGCGEGYGSALLAEHATRVVGVDYSPVAIRHANSAYGSQTLSFRVADATELPEDLGVFDVVTCFEVVEHLVEDEKLFAGVARVLAPGGTFLLSTPNKLVDELVESLSGTGGHYEYHVNVLTPSALRRRALRHFQSVAVYGQSRRRNALHAVLKGADVFNVRHRIFRSLEAQRSVASALGAAPESAEPSFRFSRLLVRQSPIMVLVARKEGRAR